MPSDSSRSCKQNSKDLGRQKLAFFKFLGDKDSRRSSDSSEAPKSRTCHIIWSFEGVAFSRTGRSRDCFAMRIKKKSFERDSNSRPFVPRLCKLPLAPPPSKYFWAVFRWKQQIFNSGLQTRAPSLWAATMSSRQKVNPLSCASADPLRWIVTNRCQWPYTEKYSFKSALPKCVLALLSELSGSSWRKIELCPPSLTVYVTRIVLIFYRDFVDILRCVQRLEEALRHEFQEHHLRTTTLFRQLHFRRAHFQHLVVKGPSFKGAELYLVGLSEVCLSEKCHVTHQNWWNVNVDKSNIWRPCWFNVC